ncbi:MAG: hypothetical protein LBS99_02435, partial [Clostridiales bacterium]|nr:hypothetical protein [Clostridiales bacterium]
GRTVIYFSFENGKAPFVGKDETDQALNETVPKHEGSGTVPIGGLGASPDEHYLFNSRNGCTYLEISI